jgi:N-acetylglucosaminyldiphosphoundecaprenol N-acetyl-beta-D-mannosaminyltransferase
MTATPEPLRTQDPPALPRTEPATNGARHALPEPFDAVPVLGVDLALTDYERTMDWMDAVIAGGGRSYVCVANVHTVMASQEDDELRAALDQASMTVPDGQPLVWAMNLHGAHLSSRVYGPDLMARYCERSAKTGVRMYLYGGRNQGALVQLTLELRRAYPGIKIVGGYSPPYRPLSAEEQARVAAEIDASEADVVWVGIGVPKQEKWMAQMRPQLKAPLLVGVGAAFDFHAGLVPQAPSWMQRLGLEWMYRLLHEPRRLWRRYLQYNPRFATHLARWYGRRRLR